MTTLALQYGDTTGACACAEPALAWLEGGGSLDGAEALRIEHACWAALDRSGDARAPARLQRAHAALQAQAACIDDTAVRERFLASRPEYREIAAAWLAWQAGEARQAPQQP